MRKLLAAILLGALIVPTAVTVFAEPDETADTETTFESSSLTFSDEFSVEFETAETENTDIVTVDMVDIENKSIVLTSLAPGTTEIYLKDSAGAYDTLFVTVAEDGSIMIDNFIKWNGWNTIDGEKKFYKDGQACVGWCNTEDNIWYCFDENGIMRTGWFLDEEDSGTWFYLSEQEETMGQMMRGWIVDSTGWKTYYLDSNGRMLRSRWINADENNELGRPAGIYYLTSDGAVQMNGWAESVTPGIYWRLRAGDGWFDRDNPECWSTDSSLVSGTVTDEERLENMIPLFDSILTWNAESPEVSETHILQYRPDDPEYIWNLVWRAVYFAEDGVDGVTIDGPNKIVPASVAEAYARGLFSNLTSLPALESDFITYDAETDTYAIPASDHSLSKTMIEGYQDGVNGSKLVTISLRRLRDPLYIVSRCVVRVVPNESNGASEFPFRISGIEKQFIPEIPEDYGEWEPMVPLFDSILTLNAESPETAATGEMQYLPDDPEYVWEAVYRGIVNFAEDGEYGVVEEEGEKTAPAELVLDYAKGLFCNLEELPALGDVKNVKYDEENNTYIFAMSDHSQSVTTIESSEIQEDGTHLVTIALKTKTTPQEIVEICTLQLKENKEPSLFPYRICGMLD